MKINWKIVALFIALLTVFLLAEVSASSEVFKGFWGIFFIIGCIILGLTVVYVYRTNFKLVNKHLEKYEPPQPAKRILKRNSSYLIWGLLLISIGILAAAIVPIKSVVIPPIIIGLFLLLYSIKSSNDKI